MKQDRFLTGILIFIAVLVVAALVLFFVRPGTATYQSDDTPQGVIYNFSLAIQNNDTERAYGYLADMENKPTLLAFRQALLNGMVNTSGYAMQVGEVQMLDSDSAWVMVTIHYLSSGPFDSGWSSQDHATLQRQGGAWKITYMPYPYWSYDWYMLPVEPVKP